MDRATQLERYMARSRRVRRLAVLAGLACLVVAAILSFTPAPRLVPLALALAGLSVAGAGAWITWGHLQEFDKELRSLRRAAGPRRTAR